jgi:hypothetical protein
MGIVLRLVLILVCMGHLHVLGVDETDTYLKNKPGGNTFDKTRWERFKDDYKYKKPSIDNKERKKPKFSLPILQFDWKNALLYLGILTLLALAVYLVLRSGIFKEKRLKQTKKSFLLTEEPEDINELDIDPLLAEALKLKDYRLAVRLQFLALLQRLNNYKHIEWRRDKTNLQYLGQLKSEELRNNFSKICRVYEAVWYGENLLNENTYLAIANYFNGIEIDLKANAYA